MTLRRVLLVGAGGKLGPAIIHALLSAGTFRVTVLLRASSKSKHPDDVHVIRISDDFPTEELVSALEGQDAVVVAAAGANSDLQIRLADVAAQVGVSRFIPADFGSCDSSSRRAVDLMPLYRAKQKAREHLQQLSTRSSLSWTSLVCGHFFDYGLETGLLSIDLKAHKARIFDSGDIKWSTTTIDTIATAVVRVLEREDETRNRMLYIQSFCITQNQLLKSLERLTGQSWQVEHLRSEDYIAETKAKVDRDPDNGEAREELVSVVGIVDANWEAKQDFANSLLGLQGDDLDQVLTRVIGNARREPR